MWPILTLLVVTGFLPSTKRGNRLRTMRRLGALAVLVVSLLVPAVPASARSMVHTGYDLNELQALAGSGPDPGTGDLLVRLDWAVRTAIPLEWREAVPVVWSIGNAGAGHLAVAKRDGRIIMSSRVMGRSTEKLLQTTAHEMGHQINYYLVSPLSGSPPDSFFNVASDYNRIGERWADCVSRVWTGSTIHTLSEDRACSAESAGFVAGILSTPFNLGATVRISPQVIVPERSEPVPAPTSEPEPEVLTGSAALAAEERGVRAPSPSPPPVVETLAQPAVEASPAITSSGVVLIAALVVLPLLLGLVAFYLVRSRSGRVLAWATGRTGGPGSGGPSPPR